MKTYVDLDLRKNQHKLVEVYKQYDTSAKSIVFKIYDGATESYLDLDSSKMYAVAAIRKPDGTQVFNGCTIDGNQNTITFVPTEQVTACPGELDGELRIYEVRQIQSDDEEVDVPRLMITATFLIKVEESVLDDARIVSTDEYNALTDTISIISQVSASIDNAVTAVEAIVYPKVSNDVEGLIDELTENVTSAVDTANTASQNAEAAANASNDAVDKVTTLETNVRTLIQEEQLQAEANQQRINDAIDGYEANVADVVRLAQTAAQMAASARTYADNADTYAYNAGKAAEASEDYKESAKVIKNEIIALQEDIQDEVDGAKAEIKADWNEFATEEIIPTVTTDVINAVEQQVLDGLTGVLKTSDIKYATDSPLLAPSEWSGVTVTLPHGKWLYSDTFKVVLQMHLKVRPITL